MQPGIDFMGRGGETRGIPCKYLPTSSMNFATGRLIVSAGGPDMAMPAQKTPTTKTQRLQRA